MTLSFVKVWDLVQQWFRGSNPRPCTIAYPFFFKNNSQPDAYSSGESHFRYFPSGKQPRWFPRAEYHSQVLQVLPVLRLRDANMIISSRV
jgi:hypothetical protein